MDCYRKIKLKLPLFDLDLLPDLERDREAPDTLDLSLSIDLDLDLDFDLDFDLDRERDLDIERDLCELMEFDRDLAAAEFDRDLAASEPDRDLDLDPTDCDLDLAGEDDRLLGDPECDLESFWPFVGDLDLDFIEGERDLGVSCMHVYLRYGSRTENPKMINI